jgi:hypothetical protein
MMIFRYQNINFFSCILKRSFVIRNIKELIRFEFFWFRFRLIRNFSLSTTEHHHHHHHHHHNGDNRRTKGQISSTATVTKDADATTKKHDDCNLYYCFTDNNTNISIDCGLGCLSFHQ